MVPYISGCALARAFHVWSQICCCPLNLAANYFFVYSFLTANPVVVHPPHPVAA